MYIDENYNNYKYLVEAHDNYIILSSSSAIHGESGDTDNVNAIIQYINPPYTIPLTYYSEKTFSFTDIESNLSNNIEDRADFPNIFICGFIIIFLLIFIINTLTRLFKKGGILLSSN